MISAAPAPESSKQGAKKSSRVHMANVEPEAPKALMEFETPKASRGWRMGRGYSPLQPTTGSGEHHKQMPLLACLLAHIGYELMSAHRSCAIGY